MPPEKHARNEFFEHGETPFRGNLDRMREDESREWEYLPKVFAESHTYLEKHRIDPMLFNHAPYDETKIRNDIEGARAMKAKFEQDMRKNAGERKRWQMATVLEATVHKGINNFHWLGKDAKSVVASEHDDIENHTDAVVQVIGEDGLSTSLALGIDVSFSRDVVGEKIMQIGGEIRDNKLKEVRYFRSPDGSFSGQIQHAPRIVLGCDVSTLHTMVEHFAQGDDAFLEHHWLQFQSLDIAAKQCRVFALLADKFGMKTTAQQYNQPEHFFTTTFEAAKKSAHASIDDRDHFFDSARKGLAGVAALMR